MSQTWSVLNITSRAHRCNGTLEDLIFSQHEMLYCMLRVCSLPKSFETWLERGSKALQPGPFGKLPPEIIAMVFENLANPNVVDFAITCKRLLAIGKPFLLRDLRDMYSPWAFGRLICLGPSTQDKDLPKGLLTNDQRAEIATMEIEGVPKEQSSLYTLAAKRYTDQHMSDYHHFVSELARDVCLEADREEAGNDAKRLLGLDMLQQLYWGLPLTYPSEGAPVLCNISKAEYVREDKLTEMKITLWTHLGESADKIGLVHALLSRVCWSPDDSIDGIACEEPYRKRLLNGPWAGDRFCITTLGEMPRVRWGMTWKDVTGEADELLVHLWEQRKKRSV